MRIAVYVRVSTSRQMQLQTIEQQLERLRGHTQAHGWDLAEENIFRDDGHSGATLSQTGLDRLRDKARERSLDLVFVDRSRQTGQKLRASDVDLRGTGRLRLRG